MPRLEDIPPELVADAVAKAVVDAVAEGGNTETIVAGALARARRALGLAEWASNPSAPEPRASRPTSPRVPSQPQPDSGTAPPPRAAYEPSPNAHPPAALGSGKTPGGARGGGLPVLTEGDVLDAIRGGRREVRVSPGTIVTALARDAARDAGLRLVEG